MQREKIVSISGLRGFSCIIIMLYHYRFFFVNNGIEIIDYGHYFVEVFVTISGFLMAYNYQNRISGMHFSDFFVKRYMKIMPLYWITEICGYAAVILSTVLSGENYIWKPMQIILELSGFYTGWFGQAKPPVNNPLWTVCSLLLCYVLYYIICRVSNSRKTVYTGLIVILIMAGAVLLNSLIVKDGYESIIGSEDSIRCIISFLMGLLLFELYEKVNNKQGELISYTLMVVFAIIVNLFDYMPQIGISDIENVTTYIVIFLFCPLILYSVIFINPVKYVFSRGVFLFCGTLSMDIYMWHWIVRIYLGSRPFYLKQDTWSGWVLLIVVTLLVSTLSHYIFMPLIYRIGVKIKNIFINNSYFTR